MEKYNLIIKQHIQRISKDHDGDSKSEPNLQRAGVRWEPGVSNFDGRSLWSFFPEVTVRKDGFPPLKGTCIGIYDYILPARTM